MVFFDLFRHLCMSPNCPVSHLKNERKIGPLNVFKKCMKNEKRFLITLAQTSVKKINPNMGWLFENLAGGWIGGWACGMV